MKTSTDRISIGRKLALLSLVTALMGLAGSAQAADSLMTFAGGSVLKIYHAYSASDGHTYVEEIPIPGQLAHGSTAGALEFFNIKPEALHIAEAPSNPALSGWHYAGDSRHLIVPMQGDIDFDVGDGKTYRVHSGEAILAEDWTGKGHRSGCDAINKKMCLVFDILLDANPKQLPLRDPPHP